MNHTITQGSWPSPSPAVIEVLVVDDSAVVRQAIAAILGAERDMRVTVASDPLFAQQKMRTMKPDVIVLDLEMPRMDGLTFLRWLTANNPTPVVICSSLATRGAEAAMQALEEGALTVIAKPQLGVRDFLHESALQVVDAVRGAARSRIRQRQPPDPAAGLPGPALRITTDRVIAVGASTGGTEALRLLLRALPVDSPGVVVVQHMPEVFTAAFAQRLDHECLVEVKEAAEGDRIQPGRVLIAPGNRHTEVMRSGGVYAAHISDGPLVSRHRPSVDVLFRSVSQSVGLNAIGVIMTGMGDDGARGMLEMRRAGAHNIAQDEASCVVYGMPKEAVDLGAVDEVLPLEKIAGAVLKAAQRTRSRISD